MDEAINFLNDLAPDFGVSPRTTEDELSEISPLALMVLDAMKSVTIYDDTSLEEYEYALYEIRNTQ